MEADPDTRRVLQIAACRSTDEGIFELDFTPTPEDLAVFQEIAECCAIDADDREIRN